MKYGPKFEFYVLNFNSNSKQVEMFNIFNNATVYNRTLSAVKKYCRSPKNYSYTKFACHSKDDKKIYGFEGLCAEIESVIKYEEWGRHEYEILAGNVLTGSYQMDYDKNEEGNGNDIENKLKKLKSLEKDIKALKKWDCYAQALPNIELIAREVIFQYRKWKKSEENNKKEKTTGNGGEN